MTLKWKIKQTTTKNNKKKKTKTKQSKHHTVRTGIKSKWNLLEREANSLPLTHNGHIFGPLFPGFLQ